MTLEAALPIAPVIRVAKSVTAEKTRIGGDARGVFVSKTEAYITKLAKDSEAAANHRGAVTITAEDIEYASGN